MPAHRFNGSTWVEHTAFVGNGGVYTDTNDNFWAWDGASWKLIQPVAPIPGGGLLPPENLTITELSDFSVEITWDDPNQPGLLEPTHVQYRIPEITSVLTEFAEPVNIFSHNSLIHDTAYTFEVRYIIREAGEIVASSLFASIPFVTLALPVGAPAEDPGGTGGQSIIPIRPPVNPGPVGGPGCWWEWELFIWDDDGFGWETTGLTGTHSGTVANFHYDLATLDPTRMYRFEFCENCNGVLSGECNFGPPFVGLQDWDAVCGGIGQSNSASWSMAGDATWGIPKICLDDAKVMSIFDAVSGLEVAPGSAYGFYSFDAEGEWQLVNSETISGPVFNAPVPNMPLTIKPGQDFTVCFRVKIVSGFVDPVDASTVVWTGGLAHTFSLLWGVASFSIQANFALAGGGTLQLDTNQYPYTPGNYIVVLRWTDGGDAELFVNTIVGGAEDIDSVGPGITATTIQPYLSGSSIPRMTHAMHYGWDRALTNQEIAEIFDEPWFTEEFCDTFNRANGALGSNYDVQYQNNTWALAGSTVSVAVVESNKAKALQISPIVVVRRAGTSARNAWASARIAENYPTSQSTQRIFINGGRDRAVFPGESSYYAAQWNYTGSLSIIKFVNNTNYVLATTSHAVVLNDVVRIRHNGTGELTLDVNGVDVLTAQDDIASASGNGVWLRALGVGFAFSHAYSNSVPMYLDDFCCGTWGIIEEPSPLVVPDMCDTDTFASGLWTASGGAGSGNPGVFNNLFNAAWSIGYYGGGGPYFARYIGGGIGNNQFLEANRGEDWAAGTWDLILRSSSPTTGYKFRWWNGSTFGSTGGAPGEWRILNAATDAVLAFVAQGAGPGGHRMRAEAEGTALRLYIRSGSTWVLKLSMTSGLYSSGQPGFGFNSAGGQSIPCVGNIVAGNL